MTRCIKVKTRDLLPELLSLDIDEGLRIESSSKDTRLFINKSASATFVLQLCNNKDEKENINNNNNNNNFVYFFKKPIFFNGKQIKEEGHHY